MDIGEGLVGVADVMEEIARLYGYRPHPRNAHGRPAARRSAATRRWKREEHVRDILVSLGLQEIITHRMTAPEIENRAAAQGQRPAPAIGICQTGQPDRARKTRPAPQPAGLGAECGRAQRPPARDRWPCSRLGRSSCPRAQALPARAAPPGVRPDRPALRAGLGCQS